MSQKRNYYTVPHDKVGYYLATLGIFRVFTLRTAGEIDESAVVVVVVVVAVYL